LTETKTKTAARTRWTPSRNSVEFVDSGCLVGASNSDWRLCSTQRSIVVLWIAFLSACLLLLLLLLSEACRPFDIVEDSSIHTYMHPSIHSRAVVGNSATNESIMMYASRTDIEFHRIPSIWDSFILRNATWRSKNSFSQQRVVRRGGAK